MSNKANDRKVAIATGSADRRGCGNRTGAVASRL